MKKEKRPWDLFRILVVPAMFLCALVQHPVTKAVAVAAFVLWLGFLVSYINGKDQPDPGKKKPIDGIVHELPDDDVFLIRQLNYRITEMIKHVYPSVSWLWVKRPDAEALRKGGCWRIQLSETGSYNFAEVVVSASGQLDITMLEAIPLQSMAKADLEQLVESEDLAQEEELDRTEANTWYSEYGSETLASIIDGLNPQGHKHLVIHEDGEIFIKSGKKDVAVNKLEWFLPRLAWDEICNLLKEDDITATVEDQGLALSW